MVILVYYSKLKSDDSGNGENTAIECVLCTTRCRFLNVILPNAHHGYAIPLLHIKQPMLRNSKLTQLVKGHTASNKCILDCHQVSLVTAFVTVGCSNVPKVLRMLAEGIQVRLLGKFFQRLTELKGSFALFPPAFFLPWM